MTLDELQTLVRALPPIEPGKQSNPFWDERRQGLRKSFLDLDINNFLRWPDVGFTMFTGGFPFIEVEYQALLKTRPDWFSAMEEAAGVGNPELYKDTNTSANIIHQAYHLLQWEDFTKRKVSELESLVEIGAGYGALCRLTHRLGFKGAYYIYDLPEVTLLQKYYLGETLEPAQLAGVQWVDTLPKGVDLLLSMWALSEMPLRIRQSLLNQGHANYYLFGYQEFFEGVENPKFFQEWRGKLAGFEWFVQKIAHHPGNSWYLFGGKERSKKKAK